MYAAELNDTANAIKYHSIFIENCANKDSINNSNKVIMNFGGEPAHSLYLDIIF